MKRAMVRFGLAWGVCSAGIGCVLETVAFAVEVKGVKAAQDRQQANEIETRWAVVGVISSDDKGFGIAVLRNLKAGRTYTLSVGEALPNDYDGYVLESVVGRKVTVASGQKRSALSFYEGTADDGDDENRTTRFIDNYYRGLGEIPGEALNRQGSPQAGGREARLESLPRFSGVPSELPGTGYDLYRADRLYPVQNVGDGYEAGADSEAEGFVVNDDAFEATDDSINNYAVDDMPSYADEGMAGEGGAMPYGAVSGELLSPEEIMMGDEVMMREGFYRGE